MWSDRQISDNDIRTIYDCICWEMRLKEKMKIREHVRTECAGLAVDNAKCIDLLKARNEMVTKRKRFKPFVAGNGTKLINDGIVPYMYMLCVMSHVVRYLTMNAQSRRYTFQFTVTFVVKGVVSTDGNRVRGINLEDNLEGLLQDSQYPVFSDDRTLGQNIERMAEFLSQILPNHGDLGGLQHHRINIIIDRRGGIGNDTKPDSVACRCFAYLSEYEHDIDAMNDHGTIPKVQGESMDDVVKRQANPYLMHFNFDITPPPDDDHDAAAKHRIRTYLIRQKCVVRFFPELLLVCGHVTVAGNVFEVQRCSQ